jgi:hypothetical protein
LVDDVGDDGLFGGAGGVGMGVLVLELMLEELGINEDPSARISMLPSVKIWKPSVLENAIRWVLSQAFGIRSSVILEHRKLPDREGREIECSRATRCP